MNTFIQKRITKEHKGFTLVELMVSVSIFAIVMMISTGTLLVLIDVNAKAQAVYSATSNLAFVLDSVSREIRSGRTFYCSSNTLGTGSALPTGTSDCIDANYIVFTRERDGVRVGYRLEANKIQQKEGSKNWADLTSADVSVDQFRISTDGSQGGDSSQPYIRLILKGFVRNGLNTETRFNIQTHMVGRGLNY